MTKEEIQDIAVQIENVPNIVPSPGTLISLLQRDFHVTDIGKMVNNGKRGTLYSWLNGKRDPNWQSYVKLLYAAGFEIIKTQKEVDEE